MDTAKLKALNKPENLLKEYHMTIPVYGIPPELLQNLVLMLTEIAKYQAPMQERINQLPTWAAWTDEIQPLIEEAMTGHAKAVKSSAYYLRQDFQEEMAKLKKSLSEILAGKLGRLEKTLQARDNTPAKRRWQWIGIGAAVPVLFLGLWQLLRILL